MTDKEKILAEIERLKNNLWLDDRHDQGVSDGLHAILKFINSLSEEPVSEELEEAAWMYYDKNKPLLPPEFALQREFVTFFEAGARWQEKKDQSTIELAEDHAMLAGMEKMKEEMMAKAIDGDVTFDYYSYDGKTYGCIAHDSFCLEEFGLKDRDKVKMILIKE